MINRVLVGTDTSAAADLAVEHAASPGRGIRQQGFELVAAQGETTG
jgi:nucleotide-binding universal stress UspA family protein